MEIDSPPPCSSPSMHSSPVSSRLSVVCSLSDHYSSQSSPQSSPMSRRNSISEAQETWRRVKGVNKGKSHQVDIEHRLAALAHENERLRAQLESTKNRGSLPSASSNGTISVFDLPFAGTTAPLGLPGGSQPIDPSAMQKLQALYPAGMVIPEHSQIPMLHLCQLQAALQQQYGSSSSLFNPYSSITAGNGSVLLPNPQATANQPGTSSAFQPFKAQKSSVIKTTRERISPDSSTDPIVKTGAQRKDHSTPPNHRSNHSASGNSLLGALLSNRRPSPTVPQSSTERRSGLASPPREQNHNNLPPSVPPVPSVSPSHAGSSFSSVSLSMSGSSKSDSESHSSASLSPTDRIQNGEEKEGNRKQQYMERRRRNNEAAKRCRANRRAVFEYRSRRVEVLEGQNDDLRKEIDDLKQEIERCRTMILQREQNNQMS
ncbi:unnamed protein product, partial [Mesorhabditis belari]|uniref:BZIP domain-containing protein n=1 Tax=Mesorhabditis belari TaxID=2138241 RepID=A0AAF3J639_9BILA